MHAKLYLKVLYRFARKKMINWRKR